MNPALHKDDLTVRIFDPADPQQREAIAALRAEAAGPAGPRLLDTLDAQVDDLLRSRNGGRRAADPAAARADFYAAAGGRERYGRWVLLPSAATLLRLLPPDDFAALRTDRNRLLITREEQQRLAGLTIAVAGLSVGAAIAQTLARQGVGGQFHLADHDHLDLSNLNRLAAGVLDLGRPKLVLCAQAMLAADPYIRLRTFPAGVRQDEIDAFLTREDGRPVDLLVEECDALEIKILLREQARARGIPVLMATSEGGLLDVERFDLEPARPLFHGLAAGVDLAALLSGDEDARAAFVMAVLGRSVFSDRTAASLVELGETVSSWPQLASAVAIGAGSVTEAARKIGLGLPLPSGRYRVDLAAQLDPAAATLRAPRAAVLSAATDGTAAAPLLRAVDALDPAQLAALRPPPGAPLPTAAKRALLDLVALVPTGGNAQPLAFSAAGDAIVVTPRPEVAVPAMDPDRRSVVVALGSAIETLRLLAPALGRSVKVEPLPDGATRVSLLPDLVAGPLDPLALQLRARCTNRRLHQGDGLDEADRAALVAAVTAAGGALTLVEDAATRGRWGALAGAADRVRFLHPAWREELAAEVREAPDAVDGLAIDTLEMSVGERAVLPLLLDGGVLARVATSLGGSALRRPAEKAFAGSAALALLHVPDTKGRDPVADDPDARDARDLCAGAVLQRFWLAATARGLAVQPWASALFVARLPQHPSFSAYPEWVRREFEAIAAGVAALSPPSLAPPFLLLRLSRCSPPSARSGRIRPPLGVD
ncbi:MAG: Rv1355c family protein [Deltaproteobacteria bacterium]|nr:Rv1355c family protein [Deltaproteobacteria bacterium]